MAIQAVLWDVGGPLNTEVEHERLADLDIRRGFEAAGRQIDDASYAAAWQWAVESFVGNAYKAVIWHLSGFDANLSKGIYQEFECKSHARNVFELRDGIAELLNELHDRGLKLGLAANQPAATVEKLEHYGIGRLIHHQGVSGTHGFRKPDTRLFLTACEDLSVQPEKCVMVGDRIDNDIAPAKQLGMRTILLRTGRHIDQQPRTWDEIPDITVADVPALRQALVNLLSEES